MAKWIRGARELIGEEDIKAASQVASFSGGLAFAKLLNAEAERRGLLWAARKLLCGGGWHGRPAKEGGGGGAPEMGFRAGPFVLCKDTKGAGTQILARKIFFTKKFSPTYV